MDVMSFVVIGKTDACRLPSLRTASMSSVRSDRQIMDEMAVASGSTRRKFRLGVIGTVFSTAIVVKVGRFLTKCDVSVGHTHAVECIG